MRQFVRDEVAHAFNDYIVQKMYAESFADFQAYIQKTYGLRVNEYDDQIVGIYPKYSNLVYTTVQSMLDDYDLSVNIHLFVHDTQKALLGLRKMIPFLTLSDGYMQLLNKFINLSMFYVLLIGALMDEHETIADTNIMYPFYESLRGPINLTPYNDYTLWEVMQFDQLYYNTELLHIYWTK